MKVETRTVVDACFVQQTSEDASLLLAPLCTVTLLMPSSPLLLLLLVVLLLAMLLFVGDAVSRAGSDWLGANTSRHK
jgi:hypothetical protein